MLRHPAKTGTIIKSTWACHTVQEGPKQVSLFLFRCMFVELLALEHTFFTPNYISARRRKPITLGGASPKPNHSEVQWILDG